MWSRRTLIDAGSRWTRAFAQGSTLLGVLMIGLIWAGVALYLESQRTNAERSAVQNSANLAHAFEEHLSRALKDTDRSLKVVRSRYLRNPDDAELRDWLVDNKLFDEHTLHAGIIGADGRLRISSIAAGTPAGIDLADRDYFRVQVAAKRDELHVGKPVVGRITGKWSIPLTRRIETADGSFGGVIFAAFDPAYLSRVYSSVDIGSNSYVNIVGTDGIIRAVGGRTQMPLGKDLSGAALLKHYAKDPAGSFRSTSGFSDGRGRLVTYRAVADFPLLVAIGRTTDDIFAAVHAGRRMYYLAATALTLFILIVIGFSMRGRLQRERMAEDLRVRNLRFNSLLANMPLGVCLFDNKGRLEISNERYVRMYHLPAGAVEPGAPLDRIVGHRKANGTFSGDVDEFCKDLLDKLAHGALVQYTAQFGDGRVISTLNQPMEGGGWVSIHEDVTEQHRARIGLEQARKFLDTVIENVPAPIVVTDPVTHKYMLINQAYESFVGLPRAKLIGKTVFDILRPKDSQVVAKFDDDAVRFKKRMVISEFSVETPGRGMRVVTTTRQVVCDENDRPEHLITVIDDITEKKKAEARIAYMAHHDPLTGLLNRARFAEKLDDALGRVAHGGRLAVLILDLDQFKQVNDTLGHHAGDELLKAVADRLRGCVGEIDAVARLGGDEFAVIQTAIGEPGDISALADRARAALRAPYDLGGIQAVVDVSIGIAVAPDDATTALELMKRADMALYSAKGAGRGIYRFFLPEMDARKTAQRRLESDLRKAIANREFELFYQPVVDIRRDEIVGVEGLLRWHHPRRGIVSPMEFIPVAEETGLIVSIGEWAIRQACSEAAKWPAGVKIAVNLSPAQFRSENLAQVVVGALADAGVAPGRLQLEITEEMLIGHNRDGLAVLEHLQKLGIQIVMDDFGIGYSSLNYLRSFQFDKIKIDRSFVTDLAGGNELSSAIVQAVAMLAGVLEVPTTAEGIETREQLELVRAVGCTEYQGYLFSPPRPAADIARLFASQARAGITAA